MRIYNKVMDGPSLVHRAFCDRRELMLPQRLYSGYWVIYEIIIDKSVIPYSVTSAIVVCMAHPLLVIYRRIPAMSGQP